MAFQRASHSVSAVCHRRLVHGTERVYVCFYMRTLGAGVRRTAYALHARGLRLCRLLLGYASVLMSCIGILYYKCILYSVVFMFTNIFCHSLFMIGANGNVRGRKEFEPSSQAAESEPLLGPHLEDYWSHGGLLGPLWRTIG